MFYINKITISPFCLFTPSPLSGYTARPINARGYCNLNWRQFFSCHNIHVQCTSIVGEDWKKMRMLMSGVFTSGKLKLMLPHIVKIGDNFAHYIDKISQECCFKIIQYLFITIVHKVFFYLVVWKPLLNFFKFCLVGLLSFNP